MQLDKFLFFFLFIFHRLIRKYILILIVKCLWFILSLDCLLFLLFCIQSICSFVISFVIHVYNDNILYVQNLNAFSPVILYHHVKSFELFETLIICLLKFNTKLKFTTNLNYNFLIISSSHFPRIFLTQSHSTTLNSFKHHDNTILFLIL